MPRSSTGPLLDTLYSVMHWVLVFSMLAIVAITGYYLYGTVSANSELFRAKLPDRFMRPSEFQHHVGNLHLFMQVLLVATAMLILSALVQYWRHAETGLVMLLLGAALFLGMPWAIHNYGGPENGLPKQYETDFGNPRLELEGQYHLAGMALIALGGAQLLVSLAALMVNAGARRPRANPEAAQTAAQVRKANDKFLGPCWTLPFCRDTEKKLCPIRQTKKPCWRKGRGCYCDQQIVLTLSGGNQYAASRGALGYMSRGAAAVVKPKTWREKRDQCLGCPVYLHHHSQKYKILTPAAIIAAIGILAYYANTFAQNYPAVMASMGRATSGLSFRPLGGGIPDWVNEHPDWVAKVGSPMGVPEWAANLANTPGIMWMMIILVAMLTVAYFLQGVEWVLYRLGV